MTVVSEGGPRRTSVMAGLCLFSGILAVMCVTTAWFLTHLAGLGEVAHLSKGDQDDLLVAVRILSWATVGPAVLAAVFWLAARASIAESKGEVGGRGLYRTGLIVSAVSVVVALAGGASIQAKATNFFNDVKGLVAEIRDESRRAQAHRGWLGVEVKTLKSSEARALKISGGAKVSKVVDGSPASKVLQPGDIITRVNNENIEDSDDLTDIIGAFRPGSRVKLMVARGEERKQVEVTLASRYPELMHEIPAPVEVRPQPAPVKPPQEEPKPVPKEE